MLLGEIILFLTIALRVAKTPQSFGPSECNSYSIKEKTQAKYLDSHSCFPFINYLFTLISRAQVSYNQYGDDFYVIVYNKQITVHTDEHINSTDVIADDL